MVAQRVQEIASALHDSIPEAFVRSEIEQPALSTVNGVELEVPVIDLKEPNDRLAIVEASENWGMFQIINHNIPFEDIKKLQDAGKEFFELPQEEKEKYAKDPTSNSVEGYGTLLQKENEGKKGWVDHLFHKIWPPSAVDHRFWPQTPSSYREVNDRYASHLHGVFNTLFESLSVGLGLEKDELKRAIGGDDIVYLLKINYYPPCPRPDLALGVVAHTDMSALTVLVPNDVPGLQACRDGKWYDVKYIPNALVVHIGDQLEIVSNGKYKAVLHRTTVNKERTRISWPVFMEPPSDFVVGPHPKLAGGGKDPHPKYKTKKYGEYCHCTLNKIQQ